VRAENDSCSVDAIQSILGCSIGKGNLILRMRANRFHIFQQEYGKSFRLVLKELTFDDQAQKREFMLSAPARILM
jgi:formylmethanofuran dehydrogenase subunit E